MYVLETAFTVQRALCTFGGKGHPVQKATPVPQERPNLGTNSLKFQMAPKFTLARVAGFFTFRPILARRADICLHVLRNVQTCVCFGGEGPRAEGDRGEEPPPSMGF